MDDIALLSTLMSPVVEGKDDGWKWIWTWFFFFNNSTSKLRPRSKANLLNLSFKTVISNLYPYEVSDRSKMYRESQVNPVSKDPGWMRFQEPDRQKFCCVKFTSKRILSWYYLSRVLLENATVVNKIDTKSYIWLRLETLASVCQQWGLSLSVI